MPSLTSSSFAILPSPHSKLSRDISRIKRRSSAGIGGRPGFDFQCHRSRNPARCQRINVFGWTTTSASRQLNNLESKANVMRVAGSIRRGSTLRSWYVVAGYEIKCSLISQDIAQLKSRETGYGLDETITSNCHIQTAFPPNPPGYCRTLKQIDWADHHYQRAGDAVGTRFRHPSFYDYA